MSEVKSPDFGKLYSEYDGNPRSLADIKEALETVGFVVFSEEPLSLEQRGDVCLIAKRELPDLLKNGGASEEDAGYVLKTIGKIAEYDPTISEELGGGRSLDKINEELAIFSFSVSTTEFEPEQMCGEVVEKVVGIDKELSAFDAASGGENIKEAYANMYRIATAVPAVAEALGEDKVRRYSQYCVAEVDLQGVEGGSVFDMSENVGSQKPEEFGPMG